MRDLGKEIHNYVRILLGATLTCIIALIGVSVTVAVWGGRMEQRVVTAEQRLDQQSAKLILIDQNQNEVNGRLGVIEERTGNIVKGIDRLEDKLKGK